MNISKILGIYISGPIFILTKVLYTRPCWGSNPGHAHVRQPCLLLDQRSLRPSSWWEWPHTVSASYCPLVTINGELSQLIAFCVVTHKDPYDGEGHFWFIHWTYSTLYVEFYGFWHHILVDHAMSYTSLLRNEPWTCPCGSHKKLLDQRALRPSS